MTGGKEPVEEGSVKVKRNVSGMERAIAKRERDRSRAKLVVVEVFLSTKAGRVVVGR